MKSIVVVGSGSGCGKTTLVCRILRAVAGLGAVKISPEEGPLRVERGRGAPGKDTDRFAASGAARVGRIAGPRDRVPEAWEELRQEFASCRAVVIEGAGGLLIPAERYVIFVQGPAAEGARPGKNAGVAAAADLVVGADATGCEPLDAVVDFVS